MGTTIAGGPIRLISGWATRCYHATFSIMSPPLFTALIRADVAASVHRPHASVAERDVEDPALRTDLLPARPSVDVSETWPNSRCPLRRGSCGSSRAVEEPVYSRAA